MGMDYYKNYFAILSKHFFTLGRIGVNTNIHSRKYLLNEGIYH